MGLSLACELVTVAAGSKSRVMVTVPVSDSASVTATVPVWSVPMAVLVS